MVLTISINQLKNWLKNVVRKNNETRKTITI